jgi:CBS domain containing-hemolysin-like protein
MSVARWTDLFGAREVSPRSSTVAGVVLQRLSRLAKVGDRVRISNLEMTVESVDGARIRSVIVALVDRRLP